MEQSWTDKRFDHVDERFDRLEAAIANLGHELRAEIQATNVRVDAMQRTMLQIGGGMIGTMILAFGGVIATQL